MKRKQLHDPLFSLLFLFLLLTCRGKETNYKIEEIWIAHLVTGDGYIYSLEPQIELKHQKYSLRYKAKYNENGRIAEIIKFLPEGRLVYKAAELKTDTAILSMIGLPNVLKWKISDDKIITDGTQIEMVLNVGDSLFVRNVDSNYMMFKIR